MNEITCHYCFEKNFLTLYQDEGRNQSFVVDCEVCCHPLLIEAHWDSSSEDFVISVSPGLD